MEKSSMVVHKASSASIQSHLVSMVAHKVCKMSLTEAYSEEKVAQLDGACDIDSEDEDEDVDPHSPAENEAIYSAEFYDAEETLNRNNEVNEYGSDDTEYFDNTEERSDTSVNDNEEHEQDDT